MLGGAGCGVRRLLVVAGALSGPKRYNRAKLESYECGIEPTPQPPGTRFPVKYYLTAMLFIVFDIEIIFLYPWAVAFDGSACSAWSRWSCSSSRCSSPTPTCGAAAGWSGTDERADMGIEEKLPSGILLTTVEKLVNYARKTSVWPATFGLACCAIEMMTTGGPRYDLARFGMERSAPRRARPT